MSQPQSNRCDSKIQTMLSDDARAVNMWAQFSQRQTKLTAEGFVQVVVLGWLAKKDASLNVLATM